MTPHQSRLERAADAAAERARCAKPGQRIYRQTLSQAARLKALIAGNAVRRTRATRASRAREAGR
jgi:hypothetical protein